MSAQKSKLKVKTKDREEIAKYLEMDEDTLYQTLAVNKYHDRYLTLEKGVASQKDILNSILDGKKALR